MNAQTACWILNEGYEIDMQIMFGKCEHSVQMHFNEVYEEDAATSLTACGCQMLL